MLNGLLRRAGAHGLTTLLAAGLVASCSGNTNNGIAPTTDTGDAEQQDVGTDAAVDLGAPDDGPDTPPEPGRVVIDPLQITFGEVRHGESETVKVAVSNAGGELIVVSNVVLKEFDRTGEPEILPGDNWDTTFEVGPGLYREIEVKYAPNDFGADRGELEIWTTDPEAEKVSIRIEAPNAYADIEAPRFLRFGEVPVGETLTKRVTIYNRGIDPLTLSDIAVGGISQTFSVSFPDGNPPTVLETNEDFIMDVQYAPLSAGTDRGTLTLTTDDTDEETFEIALTGNDPTPCLDVTPDPVDLGEAAPATAKSQEVVLLNCSRTLALDVTTIELGDDGGGVFSLTGLPELPLTIAPLQTVKFTAFGTLADVGMSQGSVSVESTDEKFDGAVDLFIRVPETP